MHFDECTIWHVLVWVRLMDVSGFASDGCGGAGRSLSKLQTPAAIKCGLEIMFIKKIKHESPLPNTKRNVNLSHQEAM